MERTALLGRLSWQLGEVVATQAETARTTSITLALPTWCVCGEAANQVLGQVDDVAGNVISDTAPFAVADFLRGGVIVGGMILCYGVAVGDVSVGGGMSVGGDAIVGGRDRPATERVSTAAWATVSRFCARMLRLGNAPCTAVFGAGTWARTKR